MRFFSIPHPINFTGSIESPIQIISLTVISVTDKLLTDADPYFTQNKKHENSNLLDPSVTNHNVTGHATPCTYTICNTLPFTAGLAECGVSEATDSRGWGGKIVFAVIFPCHIINQTSLNASSGKSVFFLLFPPIDLLPYPAAQHVIWRPKILKHFAWVLKKFKIDAFCRWGTFLSQNFIAQKTLRDRIYSR